MQIPQNDFLNVCWMCGRNVGLEWIRCQSCRETRCLLCGERIYFLQHKTSGMKVASCSSGECIWHKGEIANWEPA